MDYSRMLPEPKVPQLTYTLQFAGDLLHPSAPPPLQPQQYGSVLHHPPQLLSHSPYPTNPSLANSQTSLRLPGPYAAHGGYVGKLPSTTSYSFPGAVSSAASLYSYSAALGGAVEGSYIYTGGESPRTFAAKEAIRQYGGHPLYSDPAPLLASDYGVQPSIPFFSNSALQNPGKPSKNHKNQKKAPKKTTKLAHTAFCEVCKVDCNSQEVLNSHKQGKKHKKNLQKLQELITPKPAKPSDVGTSVTKTTRSKDAKRKRSSVVETESDLETKRNRVLEAGASVDGLRVCTVCSIVVNSQKVYENHLAGQKHAAMEEKLKEAQVGKFQETTVC